MATRTRRRAGRHADVREGEDSAPAGNGGPRKRARWYSRPLITAGLAAVIGIGTVLTVTPATSKASGFATGFVQAVRHLTGDTRDGQSFGGTPAVGALFTTTSTGQLDKHFCTASVINSPSGDLAITAAHCVTGTSGTIVFVPGYDNGSTPDQVWTVTKVYVDQAWSSWKNPDDDFAIIKVSQSGSYTPIEDVTGAEQLATGTPSLPKQVQVIGYPDGSNQPITCQNSLKEPMPDQLEFDCGGYTDGTSGGPFLTDVNSSTGQGTIVGVIGGYEQGGDTPSVSYSSVLSSSLAALYKTAVAGG